MNCPSHTNVHQARRRTLSTPPTGPWEKGTSGSSPEWSRKCCRRCHQKTSRAWFPALGTWRRSHLWPRRAPVWASTHCTRRRSTRPPLCRPQTRPSLRAPSPNPQTPHRFSSAAPHLQPRAHLGHPVRPTGCWMSMLAWWNTCSPRAQTRVLWSFRGRPNHRWSSHIQRCRPMWASPASH